MDFLKPLGLMVFAIIAWSFYPPLINNLTNNHEPFFLAFSVHSIASISVLFIVSFLFGKELINIKKQITNEEFKNILKFSGLSGLFVCLNHILFFYSLSLTNNLDVISVLFFETWPLIFLYLDSIIRRNNKSRFFQDLLFSVFAFLGFIILTFSHIDVSNFNLEVNFAPVAFFALLGGLSMAFTCYFRIKSVDTWDDISKKYDLKLNGFKKTLFTEIGVRIFAVPLFFIAFLLSGDSYSTFNIEELGVIIAIGLIIVALGSIVYDFAIFISKTAAIGALWYFMPVGSILIMSFDKHITIKTSEWFAIFILISANLFIASNKKFNKKVLFSALLFYLLLTYYVFSKYIFI
jgi:drug/metabolite transporter (DMT)-like permease